MSELITELTLALLILAALILVFQVIRQWRAGELSAWGFSTVLLVMLIGWMVTEVVKDATGAGIGQFGQATHFVVMILFAVIMTLQLRRSSGN